MARKQGNKIPTTHFTQVLHFALEQVLVGSTQVQSRGQEDPLEKETATHSSILAWETPWTEEPHGLQSIGSQKSQTRLKRLSMHVLVDLHDIIKARKQAPGSHLDIILASAMYIL